VNTFRDKSIRSL